MSHYRNAASARRIGRMEAISEDKSPSGGVIAHTDTSKLRAQLVKDSVPSPLKTWWKINFQGAGDCMWGYMCSAGPCDVH